MISSFVVSAVVSIGVLHPVQEKTQSSTDVKLTRSVLRDQVASDYRLGQFESALKGAKRLANENTDAVDDQLLLGEVAFAAGDMDASIAAYDKVIQWRPELQPRLWQRGLALYYAGRFEDGVEQFEVHQTVNSQDVENAVWHLLCAAKVATPQEAAKKMIQVKRDSRIPMKAVFELFAGRSKPEDVFVAAKKTSVRVRQGSAEFRLQQYYAHLYVGLYLEMIGNRQQALEEMKKADRVNPLSKSNLMGNVAHVHLQLRGAVNKK